MERFRALALKRVVTALRGRKYLPSKEELVEIVSFYLAASLAGAADPWALRKLADYESKRAYNYLIGEGDKVIQALSKAFGVNADLLTSEANQCGLRVEFGEDPRTKGRIVVCYQFRIKIPVYLRLAEKLSSDPHWKLVNKLVSDGYVYLTKRELSRLLENSIKEVVWRAGVKYVKELSGNERINELIGRIRDEVRKVRGFTSDEAQKFPEKLKGEIIEEAFPPCIKAILTSLLRGEHLSHHQRFALATFLLNIGASVNYVLSYFRHAPDFNERIARYQIEHLAGLKGGRKKYSVYSCDKMKTLGICVADCGTKTPIQYYLRAAKKLRGGGKRSSPSQGGASSS
ncbi:MAG: hypothetical protein J7L55_04705 [Desulfurococcales archaeon]|nr:hypothetical protein [Desulfurococcales archaeon]